MVGPNFDTSTGIFKATTNGIYLFALDGFVYGRCKVGEIKLYVNGQDASHFIEQNTDGVSSRSINGMKALPLREGDEIYLRNLYGGCIFGDEYHTFTFIGTLLH